MEPYLRYNRLGSAVNLEAQVVALKTALQAVQDKMDSLVEHEYEPFQHSTFMDLLDEAIYLSEKIEILELELDFLEEQAYDASEDEGSTID